MRRLHSILSSYVLGRFFLWVLSHFYFLAILLARWFHFKKPQPLRAEFKERIISIGNLTTGGSGKTTMTALLSEYFLKSSSASVLVLSRGYKGGDEAKMLQNKFKTRADRFFTREGKDRSLLVRQFLKSERESGLKDTVILLDDAHQNFSIHKDFNLLTINVLESECLRGLIPYGLLREPMEWALERTDAVVLTFVDLARKESIEFIKEKIKCFTPEMAIFNAVHECVGLEGLGRAKTNADLHEIANFKEFVKGRSVVLVSGIGSPKAFELTARHAFECDVARHFIFEDHYRYENSDLSNIINHAKRLGASAVVTTEKDAVKFPSSFQSDIPCFALKVRMRIFEDEEFFSFMERVLYERMSVRARERVSEERGEI